MWKPPLEKTAVWKESLPSSVEHALMPIPGEGPLDGCPKGGLDVAQFPHCLGGIAVQMMGAEPCLLCREGERTAQSVECSSGGAHYAHHERRKRDAGGAAAYDFGHRLQALSMREILAAKEVPLPSATALRRQHLGPPQIDGVHPADPSGGSDPG